MATVWYCQREQVKAALDVMEVARNDAQVDRAISAGSRNVEGFLKRHFYPLMATKYWDWPNYQRARSWRLWLDRWELASVSQLVAGGVTIPSSDYFLEPANDGPPFNRIEIDLSSGSAFSTGSTHQRAIAVTGVFCGCPLDEEQVGSLAAGLAASVSATAQVTWTTAGIGVGDILRIDTERMIVTAKSMVDSGQNTTGALTASSSDVAVLVANGSAFTVGETLLVDSERMRVVDIAGNTLTVRRAWDGTVLATHASNADVYTLSGVELQRAALGTTLGDHLSGAAVYRHVVPELVRDLNVAEAINQLEQELSGYARTIGEGDTIREGIGRGLRDLRKDALQRHGRVARSRAV
jgi:hypothetical protein